MRIAVYGLGHLGLPLASVLSRSYNVIGVDFSPVVNRLFDGWVPPHEPDVVTEGVLLSDVPSPTDMSFVVVPTPSLDSGDHRGGFDSTAIETCLRHIVTANHGRPHIAVITSTVSPGTCDRLAKMFPELSIVYNPTFIALGRVVQGLTRPDMVLLGGDEDNGRKSNLGAVADVWERVFHHAHGKDYRPHLHHGSFTEIELIKLSVNAALGTKISLANSLGELFEAYGVDPKAVEVVGRDPRIGTAYFTPGSPITGPCLPRDNKALEAAAAAKGLLMPMSIATDRVNHQLHENLLRRVVELKPSSVGILGMSYKYGVDVDTAAPGPMLLGRLSQAGVMVYTYDELLGGDLKEALCSDVVVVTQREYGVLVAPESKRIDLWPT